MYQLINLWGRQRTTSILMASGFVLVHGVTVVFSGISAQNFRGASSTAHLVFTNIYLQLRLSEHYTVPKSASEDDMHLEPA